MSEKNKKILTKKLWPHKSIGIVTSTFNSEIAKLEFDSCLNTLLGMGIPKKRIFSIKVPGALEIPFALKKLANSKNFEVLIALGVIVRGETFHFEIVALESASGLSRVAFDFNIPIANGILAVENTNQAFDRAVKKGADCAQVAIEMVDLLKTIEEHSGESVDCGKSHQSI